MPAFPDTGRYTIVNVRWKTYAALVNADEVSDLEASVQINAHGGEKVYIPLSIRRCMVPNLINRLSVGYQLPQEREVDNQESWLQQIHNVRVARWSG
jgi:hypothetical protein